MRKKWRLQIRIVSEPIALDAKRRWSGSAGGERESNLAWAWIKVEGLGQTLSSRKGPSRARSPALPGHVVPLLDLTWASACST